MKKLFALTLLMSLACQAPAWAAVKTWNIIPEESSISFSGKQMGSSFQGKFNTFSAAILFDENTLDQSSVAASIDVTSVTSADKDVATSVKNKDWLDTATFPTARFESKSFEKLADGSFKASGNLTIRDITVPVVLPFTLVNKTDSGKDITVMDGKVILDRSAFKLGIGEWADPSVVANDVEVTVHITAFASP